MHEIKDYEMGGTCSMHNDVGNAYKFLSENIKRRDHLGDWGIGLECEATNWIQLAYDRIHWRALVNTVMNFQFL
jgi:hypothetical protein